MLLRNIQWIGIGSLLLTLIVGSIARTPWFFQIDDDDARRHRKRRMQDPEAQMLSARAPPNVKDFPLQSQEPEQH